MNTIFCLLISFMAVAQDEQNLVIIGDSLTEGYGVEASQSYPALLQKKLQDKGLKWKVTNHGISGSTSASAPSRVRWVLKKPPQVVVLALGANDGLRGLKPEATEKNLDQAIVLLKEKKVRVFLSAMRVPPNYKGGDYIQKFESTFEKLAKKHAIQLIPFILIDVAGRPELNLPDGIHPNAKGHEKVAETLFRHLEKIL
ncbi:MAG: arylesterase [Bdellovibrionales bacterium]